MDLAHSRALPPNTAPVAAAPPPANPEDRAALGALENALAACEDDQDVQAARTAKAEAVADLAEFDESIPLEEGEKGGEKEEMSKAEMEVQNLIKQVRRFFYVKVLYVKYFQTTITFLLMSSAFTKAHS